MVKLLLLFYITVFLTLSGCASQQAPGGGPEDKEPPVLQMQTLADGANNLPSDGKIVFYYSENLDPLSVKKAVMLYPLNQTEINVSVRRNRISIKPETIWNDSLIYLLMIDRSVSDLRKNSVESAVSLAFSTGKAIPNTELSGYVAGLKKGEEGTMVLSRRADSLYQSVLYRTQTDESGNWSFKKVPEGSYYLGGFIDKDGNRRYDARFDDLIIPQKQNVSLRDSVAEKLWSTCLRGNFTPPRWLSATQLSPYNTELKFSKNIALWNDFAAVKAKIGFADTLFIDKDIMQVYHPVLKVDTINIHLPALSDTLHNFSADTLIRLLPKAAADTNYQWTYRHPLISVTPPPSQPLLVSAFSDSDTTALTLQALHWGAYELPDSLLTEKQSLQLAWLPPEDSLYPKIKTSKALQMQVRPPMAAEYGSLSGNLLFQPNMRLILTNRQFRRETIPDSLGQFHFEKVPSGKYKLLWYIDENSNGRLDYGRFFPFQNPEFYEHFLQEINVRTNWESEIDLREDKIERREDE
jgi:uncharacterized protein (DUF2141 family)